MRNLLFLSCVVIAVACAPKNPPSGTTGGAVSPAPTASAAAAPSPSPARAYLKQSIDGVALCQVYVDDWQTLTPKQRVYAYDLAMASLAGRDLYYDQTHRDALAVRGLLEGIVAKPGATDPTVLEKIRHFLTLVWIDNGPYDGHTSLKEMPTFSRAELEGAAKAALAAGASLSPDGSPVDLAALLQRVSPLLFDPAFDELLTAREPEGKQDIVQASAVNFYQKGLTLKQVDGLHGKHELNSTVILRNGKPEEEVWRAGDGAKVPPGRYAKQLSEAIRWLEQAKKDGTPEDAAVIDPLIRYYRTGEYSEFRDHSIAWLKADPTIEFIHGFIEVYQDPRGQKGSFEGYVFVRSTELSKRMEALASSVLYLEKQAPWLDQYKKSEIHPPVAKAYQMVAAWGEGGRVMPVGINLPNPQDIRQQYGSKSLYLSNVDECTNAVSTAVNVNEFALPEDRAEILKYSARGNEAMVSLHEVAGHGSGKVSPKLTADPSTYIKEYYSTLEEARADLVALWNIGDTKLIEAGVVEAPGTRSAMYKSYAMGVISQLRRAPTGNKLAEDHIRARQLIVKYVEDHGGVKLVERDGKAYYQLVSVDAYRAAVGSLLAELMRCKAEGDYAGAKTLIEKYGVYFDPKLRDQVVARAKAAGVPTAFRFVSPKMIPVKDAAGNVTDVTLDYTQSFEQLEMAASGR